MLLGKKPEQQKFLATIAIETDTLSHAEQVLNERLNHDEDYGFTYTLDYATPQLASIPQGLTLDATVIREEVKDLVENAYRTESLFPMDTHKLLERIQALPDETINQIIADLDSDSAWQAFNSIRDEAVTAVINAVSFQWTADDEDRLRYLESYGDALNNDEKDELDELLWRYAHSHWGLETITTPADFIDTIDYLNEE